MELSVRVRIPIDTQNDYPPCAGFVILGSKRACSRSDSKAGSARPGGRISAEAGSRTLRILRARRVQSLVIRDRIPIDTQDFMNDKVDLSFLIGRKVEGLRLFTSDGWFILNDVAPKIDLYFDLEIYYTGSDGKEIVIEDMKKGGGLLCSLLQSTIESAEGIKTAPEYTETQLVLGFSDGVRIQTVCCGFIDLDGTPVFPAGTKVIKAEGHQDKGID